MNLIGNASQVLKNSMIFRSQILLLASVVPRAVDYGPRNLQISGRFNF